MGFDKKYGFKQEECNMFNIKKNALNLQGYQLHFSYNQRFG